MTREEVAKAVNDKTWLVDEKYNNRYLVKVVGRAVYHGEDAWWVDREGVRGWSYESDLRVATAKDILELTDD